MINAELNDKPRILEMSKLDIIDDELEEMIREGLPKGIPTLFVSSVSNTGVIELKDLLWQTITASKGTEQG